MVVDRERFPKNPFHPLAESIFHTPASLGGQDFIGENLEIELADGKKLIIGMINNDWWEELALRDSGIDKLVMQDEIYKRGLNSDFVYFMFVRELGQRPMDAKVCSDKETLDFLGMIRKEYNWQTSIEELIPMELDELFSHSRPEDLKIRKISKVRSDESA